MFNFDNKKTYDMVMRDIYTLSRQDELSPFFQYLIGKEMPEYKLFEHSYLNLENTMDDIVDKMVQYSISSGVNDFVLGVSGGADSSVCMAILNEARKVKNDIIIHAYTLPILQNPEETERAEQVADFLSVKLKKKDLTNTYNNIMNDIMDEYSSDHYVNKIRQGNIKARTRMSYLYDKARFNEGVVVSTDNFSEYLAGFWTINGDVGDVSPIQNCFKSFEVTGMGRALGLPENIWRAIPTDGLGITNSDETQLQMSYLEWDILSTRLIMTFTGCIQFYTDLDVASAEFREKFVEEFISSELTSHIEISTEDNYKLNAFLERVLNSWYKRIGPVKFENTSFLKNIIMDTFNHVMVPGEIGRLI